MVLLVLTLEEIDQALVASTGLKRTVKKVTVELVVFLMLMLTVIKKRKKLY
jgi:hypothetical protein